MTLLRRLQITRPGLSDITVTIPFNICNIRIWAQGLINDFPLISLYFRTGQVKYFLMASQYRFTFGLGNYPIRMFPIEFTLRIHHLRFQPDTKTDFAFQSFFSDIREATGKFLGRGFPISQAMLIIIAGIRTISEPTIVQQEKLRTYLTSTIKKFFQTFFIKITMGSLPVIQQHRTFFMCITNSVLHCPTVITTTCLSFSFLTVCKKNGRSSKPSTTL